MNKSKKQLIYQILPIILVIAVFLIPQLVHAADPVQIDIMRADHPIKTVWTRLLEFSNIAALIFFLGVAFANLLRLQINTYAIKKILPTLIIAIILANFSFLICRILIDISSSLGGLFVAGQNFLNSFELTWSKTTDLTTGNIGAATGAQQFNYLLGAVMKVVAGVFILILAVMMLLRYYVLYFLIAISPIAFMSMALPMTKGIWTRWWKAYSQWVFMLPVATFWLWLGSKFFDATENFNALTPTESGVSIAGYIFGIACIYFAMTTPFKMAGELSSLAGKLQKFAITAAGTGTGFYAAQKLLNKGYQGAKQAAGETVQGIALNKTPYGTLVRALKTTAQGRKTRIDEGMSGPIARSGWGEKLLQAASLGGVVGPAAARRFIEESKDRKEKLEAKAEAVNLKDEKLQKNKRALRTEALQAKSENERIKSNLEKKFLMGDESDRIRELKKEISNSELEEYEKLGSEEEKAQFLEKLLKKRQATKIDSSRLEEIVKQAQQKIIDNHQAEYNNLVQSTGEQIYKQYYDEAIKQVTERLKANNYSDDQIQRYLRKQDSTLKNDAILRRNKQMADSKFIQDLQAKFLHDKKEEVDNQTEQFKQNEVETTLAVMNKKQQKQLRNLNRSDVNALLKYKNGEGQRVLDALDAQMSMQLEPVVLKKIADDAGLHFTSQSMQKEYLLNHLRNVYVVNKKDWEDTELMETRDKILEKIDPDPAKAKQIYDDYVREWDTNPEYRKVRQTRLKYILYGQVPKKGVEDAATESVESAFDAIKELEKYLPDLMGGIVHTVDAVKGMETYHRKAAEMLSNLYQNPGSPEYIDTMQFMGKLLQTTLHNGSMPVNIISDKTGEQQSANFAKVIAHTFKQRFGVIDAKGQITGINMGIEGNQGKIINTEIWKKYDEAIKAGQDGDQALYGWITRRVSAVKAGSSNREKNFARQLLAQSGILTVLNFTRDNPIDNIGYVRKLVEEAVKGKLEKSNGANGSEGLRDEFYEELERQRQEQE